MSYQIITRMAYNADTNQIETWQHSNNVWPRIDYRYVFEATEDNLFNLIVWHAERVWQGRKWRKQFEQVFNEFPELIDWRGWSEDDTYDDKQYRWWLSHKECERNKTAIVNRFKDLAKIA